MLSSLGFCYLAVIIAVSYSHPPLQFCITWSLMRTHRVCTGKRDKDLQSEKIWPRLRVLSSFINLQSLDLRGPFTLTDSAFAEMGPLPNLEDLVSILANQ